MIQQISNQPVTGDKYIDMVLMHIHQHHDQKLNIDELIRLAPFSRRLFQKRFKLATGFTVHSYIIRYRMEIFARKLLESNRPIIEIVYESGFADNKNIARQFKQAKGCTPLEYRIKNMHNLRLYAQNEDKKCTK